MGISKKENLAQVSHLMRKQLILKVLKNRYYKKGTTPAGSSLQFGTWDSGSLLEILHRAYRKEKDRNQWVVTLGMHFPGSKSTATLKRSDILVGSF